MQSLSKDRSEIRLNQSTEESPSLLSVCVNFLFPPVLTKCLTSMTFLTPHKHTALPLFRLDGSIEYSFEKILITWLGREVRKRYYFSYKPEDFQL